VITHLLDTDVCIHALKKRSAALLNKLGEHDGRMAVSDITIFELYYGAEKYEDSNSRIHIIEDFLQRLEILPFDTKAARHAGNIRANLASNGKMIGAYDVQIAAIARSQGLTLATNNVREFNRVEGLMFEKWR
jgi:tRNA(fMet)-specific endonuclease VapC